MILDGQIKELKTDKFKGWYVGSEPLPGKRTLTIEDWRTRNKMSFIEGVDLKDPLQKQALLDAQQEFEAKKLALQLEAKRSVARRIASFESERWTQASKYLENKKISGTHGEILIESPTQGTDLIIPMQDENGDVWNYQTIQENGFKTFVPGGLVEGLFFPLLNLNQETDGGVFICEGFATACAVQLAMPKAKVVCSFSAGNLESVAVKIRRLHPQSKIVIAGDDDWKKEENAGQIKANAAALASGSSAHFPSFKSTRGRDWTDWNDLAIGYGIGEVKLQLSNALSLASKPTEQWLTHFNAAASLSSQKTKTAEKKAQAHKRIAEATMRTKPYVNGITTMDMKVSKNGQIQLPPQEEIAEELLKYYDGRIVINDGAIFLYRDTHWVECEAYEEGKIIQQINILCARLATDTQMRQIFNIFKRKLLKPDRNLFNPLTTSANFLNGTLHLVKDGPAWTTEFKPHNRLDFCTNLIPITYDVSRTKRNLEFESMVTRTLGCDTPDEIEKVRALKQMYGAAIMPHFAHIFLLHGPGGTGKSSLIIPATRLLGEGNFSSVEPHEFEGFNMETMIGKLANIVLDINTKDALKDHQIKKIEDPFTMRIRRKGRVDVNGMLPRLHIFGGNDIPPTTDQGSGAHERRWTLILVDKFKAIGMEYSKNFSNEAFDACPEGVLNFALEGLDDLLKDRGHYLNPESGKRDLIDALEENVVYLQFIKDIAENRVGGIRLDPEGRFAKPDLWPIFRAWMKEEMDRRASVGKIKFFRFFEKFAGDRFSKGGNLAPGTFRLFASQGVDYYAGMRKGSDAVYCKKTGVKVDM